MQSISFADFSGVGSKLTVGEREGGSRLIIEIVIRKKQKKKKKMTNSQNHENPILIHGGGGFTLVFKYIQTFLTNLPCLRIDLRLDVVTQCPLSRTTMDF